MKDKLNYNSLKEIYDHIINLVIIKTYEAEL